ncbi:Oxygen regulatory protein NreC [Anaerolineae bacterium]|nr:Oxygen regulatory protein NreC [Anaerolineae bacterium]
MPIQILIADDHGVLRAGLRALLSAESNLQVVGEAGDGDEALRLANQLRPDIVLLDVTMPGPGGIEVTRRLKESLPETRVLILTLHEDTSLLREALRVGAAGYIIKRAVDVELITAIHAVSRGEMYIHPALTHALLKGLSPTTANKNSASALTAREVEILRLIIKGYTNRQIANALSISVRTVDTHRANLMDKLAIHDRAGLVRYATEHGLAD